MSEPSSVARDPIPTPNRWWLPQKLPMVVAGVVGALCLLCALLVIFTIQALGLNLALALASGLISAWTINRTWAFVQRRSYRQARLLLILAVPFALLMAIWATPIFLITAGLSLLAPDIHRYSPLGQGLERARKQTLQFHSQRKKARGLSENLAVGYGRLNGFIKAFIVIFAPLTSLFFILTTRKLTLQGGLLIALPAIVIVVGHYLLNRRYRALLDEGLGKAENAGLTYRVLSTEADKTLDTLVRKAMDAAGHVNLDMRGQSANLEYWNRISEMAEAPIERPSAERPPARPSPEKRAPDVTMVILTNNVSAGSFRNIEDIPGRLIFLVGSALDNWEQFRPYAHYQWVDLRRQSPDMLDALAEDLLIFGAETPTAPETPLQTVTPPTVTPPTVTRSLGTRQTPQSFDKVIVPGRVAAYLVFQYVTLNLTVAYAARLLVNNRVDAVQGAMLITTLPSVFFTLWLTTRIICREITVNRIVTLNLIIAIVSNGAGFLIGLVQPLPPGYVRNASSIAQYLVGLVIGMTIGYFVGRALLNAILGGWLPSYVPFPPPFPGIRRDWKLWRRNLLAVSISALLAIVLTSQPVTAGAERSTMSNSSQALSLEGGKLTLTVSSRWQSSDLNAPVVIQRTDVPISALLRKGSSPFADEFATQLSQLFIGNTNVGYRLYSPIRLLWPLFMRLSTDNQYQISFHGLDATPGSPLAVMVVSLPKGFVKGDLLTKLKGINSANYVNLYSPVYERQNVNTTLTAYGGTFRYLSDYESKEYQGRVILYDLPTTDFMLIIAGSPQAVVDYKADIATLITSVRIEGDGR